MMKTIIQINECDKIGKSTSCLIQELLNRKHSVDIYSVKSLYIHNTLPFATVFKIQEDFKLIPKGICKLAEYDLLLMRNDPPFDMRYITATYLLESFLSIPIVNNPGSVRNFPEKILNYQEFIPETIITEDISAIEEFCKTHKHFIVKPLYECSGKNILKFKTFDVSIKSTIELLIEKYNSPIVVQEFLQSVETEGDKRIVVLNGKILGVFSRKSSTDFRVNMSLGGKIAKAELTKKEAQICNKIAQDLNSKGIALAGIDVIDEKITEINVTSIAGIAELDELYEGLNAAKKCVNFFEDLTNKK